MMKNGSPSTPQHVQAKVELAKALGLSTENLKSAELRIEGGSSWPEVVAIYEVVDADRIREVVERMQLKPARP